MIKDRGERGCYWGKDKKRNVGMRIFFGGHEYGNPKKEEYEGISTELVKSGYGEVVLTENSFSSYGECNDLDYLLRIKSRVN